MKHVLIIDTDGPVEHLAHLKDRTFITIVDKCPASVMQDYNVQTAATLGEAVAEAQELTIITEPRQWDALLLGPEGILTTILEGAQINYSVDLDDEKRDVYNAFLVSKNLSLVSLT